MTQSKLMKGRVGGGHLSVVRCRRGVKKKIWKQHRNHSNAREDIKLVNATLS